MAITQIYDPYRNPATAIGSQLGVGISSGIQEALQELTAKKAKDLQRTRTTSALEQAGFNPQQAAAYANLPAELQQTVLKQKLQEPSQMAFAQGLQAILGGGGQPQGLGGGELANQAAPGLAIPSGLKSADAARLATLGLQKQEQVRKDQQFERKLAHEKEKSEIKQSRVQISEANKETAPYYKEITSEAKAAKNNNIRLGRLEELINKGNLTNPLLYKTLKNFNIDVPALMSADSQEFNKLSKDFLKDAKAVFGNRLTDTDLRTFLETVPELSQSNEGKQRVINNMKAFNDASLAKKQAADEIIGSNNGNRPRNLDRLVDEKTSERLDAIAQEFKTGYGTKKSEELGVGSTVDSAAEIPEGAIVEDDKGRRLKKVGGQLQLVR
jgi:hypothetical protein